MWYQMLYSNDNLKKRWKTCDRIHKGNIYLNCALFFNSYKSGGRKCNLVCKIGIVERNIPTDFLPSVIFYITQLLHIVFHFNDFCSEITFYTKYVVLSCSPNVVSTFSVWIHRENKQNKWEGGQGERGTYEHHYCMFYYPIEFSSITTGCTPAAYTYMYHRVISYD